MGKLRYALYKLLLLPNVLTSVYIWQVITSTCSFLDNCEFLGRSAEELIIALTSQLKRRTVCVFVSVIMQIHCYCMRTLTRYSRINYNGTMYYKSRYPMCIHCTRGIYSVVITWQSNPPFSQLNSPCNEFTSVWSMFVYNSSV